MEKPVGPDDENQATASAGPSRVHHRAPQIIGIRRRAFDGEGTKGMIPDESSGGAIERGAVERPPKSQFIPSPKRSIGLVVSAYVVAIAPGRCAVACMKLGTHFGG